METPPTVLVIDDELFFLARIESILKRLGYAVQSFDTGEAAVAWAESHPFVLSVVNFAREKVNPGETLRRLKSLPHPAPTLAFMPHKQMRELKPLAREAGADLIVANSALHMRLPQLIDRLAPKNGGTADLAAAVAIAEEEEE